MKHYDRTLTEYLQRKLTLAIQQKKVIEWRIAALEAQIDESNRQAVSQACREANG